VRLATGRDASRNFLIGVKTNERPENLQTHTGDQVIRENPASRVARQAGWPGKPGGPASRGAEASAEVLVGPPGRMVSNAGQQQWY
jgi:hypothetical protein